ncbi:GNAT family N-acetyltransferase [Nocardioides sp. SR21]|uniref:GNAT family N-acetyltransferase n=1 Tax=Nocardioides sp. SR21 TaxID=2919501 RepID=UPI001FA99E89|nr:GNAT family N-acetyltransferase [Nocardioides sp. SR21]
MADPATIRPGTVADAASLAELGRAVIPATYGHLSEAEATHTLETWWSEEALAESLERIPHWVAVGPTDRVVGVSNLGTRDDRNVMWKLYIHPDQQGTGLGRALLDRVIEENGDQPLWLSYVEGNERAAGFYVAHGFVEQHRAPDPPYPDQVWMRRDPS